MIIGPTVEFWKENALLAQRGCYLRVMICGMIDGLNQHQGSRDIIELLIIGKVEYPPRIKLLHNRQQALSAQLGSPPQFIETGKRIILTERARGRFSREDADIPLLSRD